MPHVVGRAADHLDRAGAAKPDARYVVFHGRDDKAMSAAEAEEKHGYF
jgi:hypothetical protein